MHILQTSFRFAICVFVNDEMGTLHHGRCGKIPNQKILKTLNETNCSSLFLKYVLHIIDILSRYVSQDICYIHFYV